MNRFKGIALAAISSATFGMTPFFSVWLMHAGLSEFEVLTYRWGVACISLLLFGLLTHVNFCLSLKNLGSTFLLTLLRATTSLSLIIAYANIASGTAATIHFMYPLAVGVSMLLFFKERLSPTFFIALILSAIGAYMLSAGDNTSGNGNTVIGLCAACISIFSYGGYIIAVKKSRVSSIEPTVFTTYVMGMGAVMFFIGGQLTGGVSWVTDGQEWLAILGLAVPATALSNFALVKAVQYIGPSRTAAFGALEPLTAIVLGVLFLQESLTFMSIGGILLIVTSVTMVILQKQ